MLQRIRNKAQGYLAWVIVALVGATFVCGGLSYYSDSTNQSPVAGSVNGQKIPLQAVDNLAHQLSKQRGNGAFEFDTMAPLREEARQALVARLVMLKAAKDHGFHIGESDVAHVLAKIPQFQQDGKFSEQRYLNALKQVQQHDRKFREQIRDNLLISQVEEGLLKSSIELPSEIDHVMSLLTETRDIGFFRIPQENFTAKAVIHEADLQKYYEQHKKEFVSPEQVKIEYITLSQADLMKKVQVSVDELQKYYQAHQQQYQIPAMVNVRHILVALPKEASDEAAKAALQKAEKILAEIKDGADFAGVAKDQSDDKGSAIKGGELGWIAAKGEMVPMVFENAAFGLKSEKDISDLVRTDYGYHILQLVAKKDAKLQSFNEVKELVEENFRKAETDDSFNQKSDIFAKHAFESVASLEPLAEATGLVRQESTFFTRTGTAEGVANIAAIVQASFSDEVLKDGKTSDIIKLDENSYILLRIKEHKPERELALNEVTDKIRSQLVDAWAQSEAKKLGEGLVASLRKGEKPEALAKAQHLKWETKASVARNTQELSPKILQAAFSLTPRLDAQGLTEEAIKGLDLDSGDYVVLAVTKISKGDPSKLEEGLRDAFRQGLSQLAREAEYDAFAGEMYSRSKIELEPIL